MFALYYQGEPLEKDGSPLLFPNEKLALEAKKAVKAKVNISVEIREYEEPDLEEEEEEEEEEEASPEIEVEEEPELRERRGDNVDKYAHLYGLDPKNRVFRFRAWGARPSVFTVVDIKPNRPKYPIIATSYRGTRYRFKPEDVLKGQGRDQKAAKKVKEKKPLKTAPKCVDCGTTCVRKISRWGNQFWACPTWPECNSRCPQEAGEIGIARAKAKRPYQRGRRRYYGAETPPSWRRNPDNIDDLLDLN